MGLDNGQWSRVSGLEDIKHGRGNGRGWLELRGDVFRVEGIREPLSGAGGWSTLKEVTSEEVEAIGSLHTLVSEPWRRLKVRSRGRPALKAAPYSG